MTDPKNNELLLELKASLHKRLSLTKPDKIEHKACLHNLKLVEQILSREAQPIDG